MKYIDAEKLKAEIDRQEIGYNTDGKHAAEYDACRKILEIIASLQQEQPEVDLEKDEYSIDDKYIERSLAKVRLEKELAEYLQYWEDDEELGLIFTTDTGVIQIELDDIRDLARHFYELGLKARKEE